MWAKDTLLNVKRNTFHKEGSNLYEWKLYGLWNRLVNTTSKLATQHFGPPACSFGRSEPHLRRGQEARVGSGNDYLWVRYTLPETNKASENEWLEDEIPFLDDLFSGANCSYQGGYPE